MSTEHPYARPKGSEVDMFIQWKGTRVCLDFDAEFAYFVACPRCGVVYEMGTQVIAKRTDDYHHPVTLDTSL